MEGKMGTGRERYGKAVSSISNSGGLKEVVVRMVGGMAR